jgi:Flp pilus assembly protein TadG
MMIIEEQTRKKPRKQVRRIIGRFRKSQDGVAAIEFAMLSLPFFMLVFATIEVFVAFAGEQLLENAVDTMSRQVRTGQITFQMGRAPDKTEAEFRAQLCEEISLMITCPENEDPNDQKLYLDVREFASFAAIPNDIPRVGEAKHSDIDPSSFDYDPGGPGTINIVRAYYRWEVMTDLVRPFITNIRKDGEMPRDYLMVATSAFRNEEYP